MHAFIRSLRGSHSESHRDSEKILEKYKHALDEKLLYYLRIFVTNNNPYKFKGRTTAAQRNESRAYGNHSSITKNMHKVEKTMNKEERNNFVGVFFSWIEKCVSHMYLTPQELLVKPRKKDTLVFDAAFRECPESVCIDNFTKVEDEIDLEYGKNF